VKHDSKAGCEAYWIRQLYLEVIWWLACCELPGHPILALLLLPTTASPSLLGQTCLLK